LIIRDDKGGRIRSIIVGIQVLLYIPNDLIQLAIWPFIKGVFNIVYYFFTSIFFITLSTIEIIFYGIFGYLEASDKSTIIEPEE